MTNLDAERKALVDFTQEIRFAVVMYGVASLAIYMNGGAQELLRLVRAMAPMVGTQASGAESGDPMAALYSDVSGSEAVYRKLGRMLSQWLCKQPQPLSPFSNLITSQEHGMHAAHQRPHPLRFSTASPIDERN